MRPAIISAGLENGGHWPWLSMSFWPFWLRILGNLACLLDNLQWILSRITKFAQICIIIWFSQLVLNMEVIFIDLQGHLSIISTKETAFSIAIVSWFRQAKGCYTSQMCCCFYFVKLWDSYFVIILVTNWLTQGVNVLWAAGSNAPRYQFISMPSHSVSIDMVSRAANCHRKICPAIGDSGGCSK